MAKKAWIEREKRKRALVQKYAALRAELKAKRDYAGLAKLPGRQPGAIDQPLSNFRPPPWLPAQVRLFPSRFSRGGLVGLDSRSDESELVTL
jgi:hypothetical protein